MWMRSWQRSLRVYSAGAAGLKLRTALADGKRLASRLALGVPAAGPSAGRITGRAELHLAEWN